MPVQKLVTLLCGLILVSCQTEKSDSDINSATIGIYEANLGDLKQQIKIWGDSNYVITTFLIGGCQLSETMGKYYYFNKDFVYIASSNTSCRITCSEPLVEDQGLARGNRMDRFVPANKIKNLTENSFELGKEQDDTFPFEFVKFTLIYQ